ncbi:hypothetical protein DPMN_066295 [Dreissena polymorpha]|uniref:Uncharacterized protein n=2 Tax=Dreissena polymorpha TaxID=45954 RepID=A0A9D3YYP5_DREPO|nr:hypothetical protein DPMN_066295 [Dreissena polymorpha]
MKSYACNFPWFVKKVTKLPTPYAGVQYENGDIIQSHREGIVGAFVQDNIGRKYGLTCAHLLGNPGNDQPVYIRESDGNLTHFATSVSNLIVRSYIIDFAALKIKDAFERFCEIAMRDEDMLNRPWEIWDAQGTNIVSMNVFKYGRGDSILKFGIIASADMEFPTPALPGAAQPDGCCFVLIESLPGSDEPFAVEGDSGSVVCHTRLLHNIVLMNNPNEPRVTAISMVRLGGLEIEGVELGHFFSFALRHALQSVAHQANLQLSPQ